MGSKPYPDDFNEVQSLKRVEEHALNIVIRARNAQNAETGDERERWVESVNELAGLLQQQLEYHEADYGSNSENDRDDLDVE